jgi:hypothetical protein
MYTGTGIGRTADSTIKDARFLGSTSGVINRGQSLEGTVYGPNLRSDYNVTPLIGNPALAIERTSAYEVGFQSEFGRNFAVQVTGYAKDQSGLTGYRQGGVLQDGTSVLDFGQTYNPTGTGINYRVLVNTDYQTVRGAEFIVRRRLANYWAFTLQYGYQQVMTNAAPPELELQKIIEGYVSSRSEIRSEVDQPHLFTGILRFEFGQRVPQFRWSSLLKETRLAFTTRAAAGLPYTPATVSGNPGNFTGSANDRLERNSGTAPATWSIDMRGEKGFRTGNLRYSAFFQVNNLLDRKNCASVFPTTGQCDTGALIAASTYIGPRQGGGTPTISLQGGSSTNWDRPNMYGPRRSITSGLRLSF